MGQVHGPHSPKTAFINDCLEFVNCHDPLRPCHPPMGAYHAASIAQVGVLNPDLKRKVAEHKRKYESYMKSRLKSPVERIKAGIAYLYCSCDDSEIDRLCDDKGSC